PRGARRELRDRRHRGRDHSALRGPVDRSAAGGSGGRSFGRRVRRRRVRRLRLSGRRRRAGDAAVVGRGGGAGVVGTPGRGDRGGGTGPATTLASPVAASAWTFAVGRPTPEAEGTISVVNPGRSRATVTLQAYAPGGGDAPRDVGEVAVPAGRQGRFDLGAAGGEPRPGGLVRASAPGAAAPGLLRPAPASPS